MSLPAQAMRQHIEAVPDGTYLHRLSDSDGVDEAG
jgi:hypothetical protein